MTASDLKKELIGYIENTNDEGLLSLIKEDFVFYGEIKDTDITDGLSFEQLKELQALSEEDETIEIHTLTEFKKGTQQWRTR